MAKAWEEFFDDILPDVPGCPQPLAVNAIKQAAIEFCEHSFVYQVDHPAIDAAAGQGEYTWALTPPVHLSLPGTAGNYASTPDSAANSVTGDIDILLWIDPNSWASNQVPLSKWNGGVQSSYQISIDASGTLTFLWNNAGTWTAWTSSVAVPFSAGAFGWIRVTLDVNNGAGESDTKFFTSGDGVIWTQLGVTRTTVGVTSIFNSTTPLRISGQDGTEFNPLAGSVYYAEVRNGIDGPVVASFDPSRADAEATTFVAATGETWTVNQSGATPARIVGISDGLKVVRPERVWYDKKPLTPLARRDLDALYAYWPGQEGTPSYFVQEKLEKLILVPKPSAALVGGILAKVSARPARSATGVDDELWEKYLEVIASGAKAKLFAMKKKPWTDSALANYHRQLFEDGIARAKIAATRGHGRAKLRTQAHFF